MALGRTLYSLSLGFPIYKTELALTYLGKGCVKAEGTCCGYPSDWRGGGCPVFHGPAHFQGPSACLGVTGRHRDETIGVRARTEAEEAGRSPGEPAGEGGIMGRRVWAGLVEERPQLEERLGVCGA